MRKYILIFFFFYPVLNLLPQQTMHNNLHDELSKTSNDTLKLFLLDQIGSSYIEKNWDSASYYEEKSLLLSKQIHTIQYCFWVFLLIENQRCLKGN
jgi:hypothetical protein